MESNYDEDLSDNIFFQVLQSAHFELFQRATIEGWVICVPRLGSLPKYALTHDDFYSHILIPSDELPETHFRSLNDKDVRICNRIATVESNETSTSFSTLVLFEETFYTEDMLKYKVLCIENPLQYYSENNKSESTAVVTVQTLRDCIDLLWTESSGKEVLVEMDEAISGFLSRNNKLEFKKIDVQQDLVSNLYNQCMQIALHNKRLHEKTFVNRHLYESVKLSVESYILHGVYKKLIKGITACTAVEDSKLNKIIRNLSDIQLRDLDIRLDLYDTIPRARRELARVDGYSTVLGKVGCLRRTLLAISKQDSTSSQGNIIAADDLLPILVFLVIKSGLANWIAHLTFMKQFCFSASINFQMDQHSFLVTSLEAAIEHVNSGSLLNSDPEAQLDYYSKTLNHLYESYDTHDSFKEYNSKVSEKLTKLFEFTRQGNIEKIVEILDQPKKQDAEKNVSDTSKMLCHPLCSCDKCEFQLSMSLVNSVPTIQSCDDKGYTVLHIASMFGQPKAVDLLINFGANVNAVDQLGATPLHYACMRGHQNELLLLLHSGAKIDSSDNEGNTPLHCASNNGHDGCVKALLYFCEQSCYKFDINKKNNHGDTPLHSAARWGYKFIVKTLLDYGANPMTENKRKLTPLDYAHNLHIAQLLTTPRLSNLKLIIPQFRTEKHDIQVAAATQTRLDFTDEDKPQTPKGRKLEVGDRPHTVEQMKKVDRLLIAITHGDIHLSCFYLGLEGSLLAHNCHPLCECKQKKKDKDEFGELKSADVLNVNICNSDGFTPMHMAAMHGRNELVQILLKAGGYTNVQTRKGLTPLHLACQNQRIQIVQMLLDARCDVNIQDCKGNSALHYACETKNVRLVELLIKYKPNRYLRNNDGRTVLEETEENMCLTLTRLLTEGLS